MTRVTDKKGRAGTVVAVVKQWCGCICQTLWSVRWDDGKIGRHRPTSLTKEKPPDASARGSVNSDVGSVTEA